MASPMLFRKEPLKLVLDGEICVGKSAWLNALTTGHYRKKAILHTKFVEKHEYNAVVEGAKYKTVIYDTNGEKSKFFQADTFEIYKSADVIIEFFPIDRPTSFDTIIDRIHFFRCLFPKTPFLLVGTKSDLKNAPVRKKSYFPSAFGPFVAKRTGAFKYVECSALKSFNVNKVMEEAIWVASTASSRMRHDVYQDVNSMVIDKVSLGSDWLERIKQLNVKDLNSLSTKNSFQDAVELLDREFTQFESVYQGDATFNGVYISRNLELERILISHSRDETFLSELRQPICALWYTLEINKKKAVHFHVCQPSLGGFTFVSRLFEMNKFIEQANGSAINVFVVKQDCSEVTSALTATRNLCIRSLVMVDCDGTLTFPFLANLNGLEYLVIKDTYVMIDTLDFPVCFRDTMKHLVLNNCGIIEPIAVPSVIRKLKNLELLNVAKNNFESLPPELGCLRNVKLLLLDRENVVSLSTEELKKSAQEIFRDLALMPENFVENKVTKLVVVGQNEVGKTTLINSLKNTTIESPGEDDPTISILCLENDVKCNVFDLVQDVEYFNTHPLVFSSNALNLVAFNLNQVILGPSENLSSEFNLCRLELWLKEIASQEKMSYAIIVGTHADSSSVCEDIIQLNWILIRNLFSKYGPTHRQAFSTEPSERCMICHPDLAPASVKVDSNVVNSSEDASMSPIPHILGYWEFSTGKENSNTLRELRFELKQSLDYLVKESKCGKVCKKWFSFANALKDHMSNSSALEKEPIMPLSSIHELATDNEIYCDHEVLAILRFFHSQGTFLWYENLSEMRDIVILDPQWLLDQLRTLVSHRPSVSSICDGVLHRSELSTVWAQMSDDNRRKLLALFRSVGLCFSISDTEELFPCNLPVGWPDENIWPSVPESQECQTSLLFKFSFVPPSFFPNLIVEVNKNETFARNVKPLYYRFHIVYIRKDQRFVDDAGVKGDAPEDATDDDWFPTQDSFVLHTVHFELMSHNNSLIVAVRGPDPPSIIPDIRSTIETVTRCHYPGIRYSENILCPKCVIERVQPPASFRYDVPHDGACENGHKVGTKNILDGKYDSMKIVPSAIAQTSQVFGETLDDHFCPQLFLVLPESLQDLSWFESLVVSKESYAVHLLCECPGQWHFVDFTGLRVKKPKEFFEKHGRHICQALKIISKCIEGLKIFDPTRIAAVALSDAIDTVSQNLESILESYLKQYPHLRPTLDSQGNDPRNLTLPSVLLRSELSSFLSDVQAKVSNFQFGPLFCTYVAKTNKWLWLCKEHNARFQINKRKK